MNIGNFIPWIVCILFVGGIIFAIIMKTRKDPLGVEYVKVCALLLVGIFVFVSAAQGFGVMVSNLLGQASIHLSEKLSDFIGFVIVGVWGICLYLYIDHNK